MTLLDIGLKVDPTRLSPLCDKLRSYGYLETPIAELLGRFDISELVGKEYPSYIWRCEREDSELAKLVGIFLMGRATDRETLTALLGQDLLEALKACGLLLEFKGQMASHAVIYPCLGRYILTDQWVGGSGPQSEGKVYELGTDSYVLARVTPRRGVRRALDLCTGSGVHAVMSAQTAELSRAVDINPRALQYTELNAALNDVGCSTHLGDLYTAVEGETFDLITANPPFVPSPDPDVLVHQSAGESGEEVPQRLVAGLPTHLEPGGLFSMVLDHPVFESETYLDRLERWLGHKSGWGIAVLTFHTLTVANYIRDHLQGVETYDETFRKYLESYARLGIQSMEFANVFITRLKEDAPNWKVEQRSNWPNVSLVPQVEEWLDAQRDFHSPSLRLDEESKPRLSSHYRSVWHDWDRARGALEVADGNWFPPDPLSAEETDLLLLTKSGELTVRELRAQFKGDFDRAIRGLGKRRALAGLTARRD